MDGRADRRGHHSCSDSLTVRSRLLPYWQNWPLAKIDHTAVQQWVSELGKEIAPSTVASCYATFSSIIGSAIRDRLIAHNPCVGIRLPARRKEADDGRTVSLSDVTERLLPHVPVSYRALVALAAGAGLRWGDCLGLCWGSVDLDASTLSVVRVVIEVSGQVAGKPYPKSAAGRRTVPLAPFLHGELARLYGDQPPLPAAPVVAGPAGGALLRSNFRRRIWRPALVRAGLLGTVATHGPDAVEATWLDNTGFEHTETFRTERDAVATIARTAAGGLRFHGLRHCYATWLVSEGIPVNVVQRLMGHERSTTTLDLYTHAPAEYFEQVRSALSAASSLPITSGPGTKDASGPSARGA